MLVADVTAGSPLRRAAPRSRDGTGRDGPIGFDWIRPLSNEASSWHLSVFHFVAYGLSPARRGAARGGPAARPGP